MKRIFAINILLIFTIVFSDRLYAQDKKLIPISRYPQKDTAKVTTDTSQQKDMYDVLQSIFVKNYKPAKNDSIGRKPILSFVPAIGYSLQTEAAATLTGNIVFRSSPDSKSIIYHYQHGLYTKAAIYFTYSIYHPGQQIMSLYLWAMHDSMYIRRVLTGYGQ